MAKKRLILGELEIDIMNALWDHRNATVKDIVNSLSKKKLHYNTVMTVTNRLWKKKYIKRYKSSGGYRYQTLISREELSQQYLDMVSSSFFKGSTSQMLAAFLQTKTNSIDKKTLKLLKEIQNNEI